MKYNFKLVKLFCPLLISFCFSSCSFTTTKTKNPEFKISIVEISANLKTLVSFEHVNLNGTENTINGLSSSQLEVQIINSSTALPDDSQIKDFVKPIAKQLKEALKNPSDFNTYNILFVTTETSGAMTKTSTRGASFKSEEL